MNIVKEFSYRKIGFEEFGKDTNPDFSKPEFKSFIKILLLQKGSKAVIDFNKYNVTRDTLFFIGPDQLFRMENGSSGKMVYYNRDFYCIEIHDKEVACDGVLFNNVYQLP